MNVVFVDLQDKVPDCQLVILGFSILVELCFNCIFFSTTV